MKRKEEGFNCSLCFHGVSGRNFADVSFPEQYSARKFDSVTFPGVRDERLCTREWHPRQGSSKGEPSRVLWKFPHSDKRTFRIWR